jgi:hypothetical protein
MRFMQIGDRHSAGGMSVKKITIALGALSLAAMILVPVFVRAPAFAATHQAGPNAFDSNHSAATIANIVINKPTKTILTR